MSILALLASPLRSRASLFDPPLYGGSLYHPLFPHPLYDGLWPSAFAHDRPGFRRSIALPSALWPNQVVQEVVEALADLLLASVRDEARRESGGVSE